MSSFIVLFRASASRTRMMPVPAVFAAVLTAATVTAPARVSADEIEHPVRVEILYFERAANPGFRIGPQGGDAAGLDAVLADDRAATVQLALPGLLAAALIPYQHVQLVAPAGRLGMQDQKPERESGTSADAKPTPAEFFIRGFVALRGSEAVVISVLGNRKTGQSRRLKPVNIPIERLNVGIEPLAFIIASEIARQKGIKFTPRAMIVACVRDDATAATPEVEAAVQRSAILVVRALTLESGARRIDWSTPDQSECLPLAGLQELAKERGADAVIALAPQPAPGSAAQQGAARAVVKRTLHAVAPDNRFAMPDLVLAGAKPAVDVDELARQITSLLGAVLTVTGNWNTSDCAGIEDSASAYLERGRQVLARRDLSAARSAALQDYFFTMATARAHELSTADASAARFHLARIRLAQGRTTEAKALLAAAAAQDRENLEIKLAYAELSLQLDDYGSAKAQYEDAIRRFPKRPEAYERLAAALALHNEDDAAAEVYRKLIAALPDASLAAYRGLAKILLAKGDWPAAGWTEAASILQAGIANMQGEAQQLELKRELAGLYTDAGRSHYLKQDFPVALDFLDKSIATMPSVRAHFYRAMSHMRQPDGIDRAVADYAAVISLSEMQTPPAMTPEYVGSRLDMLEVLTVRGKYDEAIARAEETLKLFAANKEAMGLEPVVRLIKLAAKIAGNVPSYRVDADELVTVSRNSPRRFTYGPFVWLFETIDQFVADQPGIPDPLKCLFRQVSQSVQNPSAGSEAACS